MGGEKGGNLGHIEPPNQCRVGRGKNRKNHKGLWDRSPKDCGMQNQRIVGWKPKGLWDAKPKLVWDGNPKDYGIRNPKHYGVETKEL